MELPRLAGWSDDYPKKNPKDKILLVLDDFIELKKDKKLAESHSWLSTFARNINSLEKDLLAFRENKHFSKDMKDLLNWIQNAEEDDLTFSDILFDAKESHYKDLKDLASFIKALIRKDKHGLSNLIKILKRSLK